MPPWRGVRQVLEVGPWGKVVDNITRKQQSSKVLWLNATDGSTQLLKQFELPPIVSSNHRRIVAISDTHGKHRFVPIPTCDVMVHCGDILQRYGYAGDLGAGYPVLYDFCRWLRSSPATHKVFIGGNHDRLLEKLGEDKVRSLLQRGDENRNNDIHYLCDDYVDVAGLRIYGSPWSPSSGTGNKAFQQGADPLAPASGSIPVDILLTHAYFNMWEEKFLDEYTVQFWAHGHWHDGQGETKVHSKNGCVSINVASNDMIYRPKNPPIVLDLPVRETKE